jgi:hypothetical protein
MCINFRIKNFRVEHSQNKGPRTKWLLIVKSSPTFILNHDTQNVPMCNFMFVCVELLNIIL